MRNTIRILKFYSNNDFAFKDVHNEELFYQNGKILVEMVQLFEKYRIVYPSKHQFLGDLFEQLLNKGFKQNEGQFFTPMPITRFIWDSLPVDRMVKSERGTVYPKVIDYACGAGHFLTEAIEAINHFVKTDGNNAWVKDHIFGIEKDYRLARVAKISLFMNGAGEGNIIFGDGLENAPDKQIENGTFDILVANPPYSVKDFKQHLQLKNNEFELLDKIGLNGGEIETLFVERIAQLLKPQGIAAVILPSSILSNDSASYIAAREQLLKNFYIRSIVAFGSKTFGATGTNTVVLFLEKFNEPPKLMDIANDSVEAILNGKELDEWQDKEILESYAAQIEQNLDIYKAFLKKELSFSKLSDVEYFRMYCLAFADSAEARNLEKTKTYKTLPEDKQKEFYLEKLYAYIRRIEAEKLYYFALVYKQKTVIIKAPADNNEQKKFLGYDWSNRKGNEGIQIITAGGKMYDDADREKQGTLAYAIRQSFGDNVPSFTAAQTDFGSVVNTKDMLDYVRVGFNKSIRISVTTHIDFKSKYEMQSIGTIFPTIESGSRPEGGVSQIEEGILSLGGEHIDNVSGYIILDSPKYIPENYYNSSEKGKVQKNDILICKDGARTGKVAIVRNEFDSRPAMLNEHVFLLRSGNDTVQHYTFQILYSPIGQALLKSYISGSAQGGLNSTNLKQIKIPIPPIDIQNQIIAECEKIDEEYNTTRMSIESYRKKIENLFNELEIISTRGGYKLVKLSSLCMRNMPKSEVATLDDDTIISFVEMASVSNFGYIDVMDDKTLGEVKKGGYTYFAEGDIIIAKITPCMENGKCAIAKGLKNHIGFGSSEFHTFRCNDKVKTEFLFGYLNRSSIRKRAAENMTGASGHRRVPIEFYENLDIPLLDIAQQNEVVAKAQEIEEKIAESQKLLESLQGKTADIINKYLQ